MPPRPTMSACSSARTSSSRSARSCSSSRRWRPTAIDLAPLELALWAIPTAIAAFLIHGARLLLLDRKLGGARPMITLHWLYALAGAMFAAFALLQRARPDQPQALRQCRLLGADGAEPARRRPASATSATACWCSASPASPASASSAAAIRRPPARRSARPGRDRLGNRLFLPALIIPVDRARRHPALQLHAARQPRLDRGQARDLRLPRPRRPARAGRHLRLAAAAGARAAAGGPPADRRDRLGGGAAADARRARRAVRRGRRRRRSSAS